ncbi:MAG: acid phosphatase [Herpetosiphonaceae bacterium]|nr:MAG: acid phosphatase [Herpetosiphonaceae bacterium]
MPPMIRVLFVCLGNICRSPMAEAVFQHMVEQEGLSDTIEVDSVGIGAWHVGEPAHRGTRDILRRHGIACTSRARQVTSSDLKSADYVVAMDAENVADLRRLDRQGILEGKLYRLLDFAPGSRTRDVPDPYYEGNFEEVYELVSAGCRGLLDHIRKQHEL